MEDDTFRDVDENIEINYGAFMYGDTDQPLEVDYTPSSSQQSPNSRAQQSPNSRKKKKRKSQGSPRRKEGNKKKKRSESRASSSQQSSSQGSPTPPSKKPNKKRKRQGINRSLVWEHFEKFMCPVAGVCKARCIYCKKAELRADSKSIGTTPLWNHLESCSIAQAYAKENNIDFRYPKKKKGKGVGASDFQFDQKYASDKLTRFLILDEMPFSLVEKQAFREFIEAVQPAFVFPSRKTATINCYELYMSEKERLRSFLATHSQRVSITTDTWSSLSRVNFMCLTVHFIDDDWKLHKKILNFCPIDSHKGKEMGRDIEICLNDWGLEKIFSVTVDNASANDNVVKHLKRRFGERDGILEGKYIHVRCVAHIVNLVVKDGLKEEKGAISRIRAAIDYIRSSTARLKKFKNRSKLEKLDSNKTIGLDVKTRWNSTFEMLETAVAHQKVFEAFELEDRYYKSDLGDKLPKANDWEKAKLLVVFLKNFYNLTLRVSGYKFVTANVVFDELYLVDRLLKYSFQSDDHEVREMAKKMKEKYDKYFGKAEKMNFILYYATILDPRHKLESIKFKFSRMYPELPPIESNDEETTVLDSIDSQSSVSTLNLLELVQRGFQKMFLEYQKIYRRDCALTPSPVVVEVGSSKDGGVRNFMELNEEDDFLKARKKAKKGKKRRDKSELERYLDEECEEDEEFDILEWWKRESHRFPILARMARDILAVPVSTVASESAFSTGGRILDLFRSSLSPKIAQAIICAQDWMRSNVMPIKVEEDLAQLEKLEQEFANQDTTLLDA